MTQDPVIFQSGVQSISTYKIAEEIWDRNRLDISLDKQNKVPFLRFDLAVPVHIVWLQRPAGTDEWFELAQMYNGGGFQHAFLYLIKNTDGSPVDKKAQIEAEVVLRAIQDSTPTIMNR